MKRKSGKRGVGKEIELVRGERVFVGVDAHKKDYHVAVWSDERGLIATWVQPACPAVLGRRLMPHGERIAQVVYEAGPTGYGLVRSLRAAGLKAEVIAPSEIPIEPGRRAKSDRRDCAKLAEYAAKGLLKPVRAPSEQEEADRQVVRLRGQFLKKRRVVRQQIKAFLLVHGLPEPSGLKNWSLASVRELGEMELDGELGFCLQMLLDELRHADAQLRRVEARIRAMARSRKHRAAVELLRTAPGVGPITSITFRTELVAPERFDNERQVAKALGLAPGVRQSGDRRIEGPIMKSGNRRLRTVLVEAAWRWVALDPGAGARYRRLVANTGRAQKAIVAMARKLGIVLWRMLVTGEIYRTAS
jgi:transposase